MAGDPDDDHFAWVTSGMDFGGPWGWHRVHPCFVFRHVIPELHHYEGLTWQAIQKGTNKGSGHFIDIRELHKDAQARLAELGIDLEQPLFELKIDNKKERIWGFRRGKLHILWWDPLHEVYRSTGADKRDRRIRSPKLIPREPTHPVESCPFTPGECNGMSYCDACATTAR